MVQKDLILDFNLFLCEKFGYRESCSVMSHANGFCVDIRERDLDCYCLLYTSEIYRQKPINKQNYGFSQKLILYICTQTINTSHYQSPSKSYSSVIFWWMIPPLKHLFPLPSNN